MLDRRIIGLVLAVTALGLSGAAHAQAVPAQAVARAKVSDPVGDVKAMNGYAGDAFLRSTDISGVTVDGKGIGKKIFVAVHFDALMKVERGSETFEQNLSITNMSVPYERTFMFNRNPWASGNLVSMAVGDQTEDCKGAKTKVDRKAGTLSFWIPKSCIAPDNKQARFLVQSNAVRAWMDAEETMGADAAKVTEPIRLR